MSLNIRERKIQITAKFRDQNQFKGSYKIMSSRAFRSGRLGLCEGGKDINYVEFTGFFTHLVVFVVF